MSSEETIKEVPHDWPPLTRVVTNVPQEKKKYLEEPESSPMESSPTTSELKYGQTIEELEDTPIILSWRSWVVVAVASFALISQGFVIVAAGQVLAFISSDLGDDGISGWVIRKSQFLVYLSC
jgi:rhodanese-related sulfurtransferase